MAGKIDDAACWTPHGRACTQRIRLGGGVLSPLLQVLASILSTRFSTGFALLPSILSLLQGPLHGLLCILASFFAGIFKLAGCICEAGQAWVPKKVL